VEIVQANLDVIVGIKVRMYTGLTSLTPLVVGRELADEVGLPLVVHLAPPPPSFADILPYLRPGDVITHVYHPGPGAIVGRNGRVRSEYKEARARGVLIDTGTARFHTNFPMVRAAFEQEFFPDTISTDLTPSGVGSLTIDLPTSITKYMAFGMSLNDALAAVTITPARLLPPGTGIGQLAEGMPADLGVFALEEGKFSYDDYFGNSVATSTRLVNHVTIKDGQVLVPQPTPPVEWGFVKR
ncbi:MAG: amidohydrolase family protein, partial [Chloroflexi bacterium]|nr:amidohydrolase family protein [Chloroflexota bacterium]